MRQWQRRAACSGGPRELANAGRRRPDAATACAAGQRRHGAHAAVAPTAGEFSVGPSTLLPPRTARPSRPSSHAARPLTHRSFRLCPPQAGQLVASGRLARYARPFGPALRRGLAASSSVAMAKKGREGGGKKDEEKEGASQRFVCRLLTCPLPAHRASAAERRRWPPPPPPLPFCAVATRLPHPPCATVTHNHVLILMPLPPFAHTPPFLPKQNKTRPSARRRRPLLRHRPAARHRLQPARQRGGARARDSKILGGLEGVRKPAGEQHRGASGSGSAFVSAAAARPRGAPGPSSPPRRAPSISTAAAPSRSSNLPTLSTHKNKYTHDPARSRTRCTTGRRTPTATCTSATR